MRRKGQAALEYLMNYWWALLIIIIIGVLIWRFLAGIPAPTRLPFQTTKVRVTALSIFDNATAYVALENLEGTTINLTYFEISLPGGCMINSTTALPKEIPSRNSYTFTLTNSTPCSLTAGSSVTANFTMKYIVSGVPLAPTDQQTVQIQRSI